MTEEAEREQLGRVVDSPEFLCDWYSGIVNMKLGWVLSEVRDASADGLGAALQKASRLLKDPAEIFAKLPAEFQERGLAATEKARRKLENLVLERRRELPVSA